MTLLLSLDINLGLWVIWQYFLYSSANVIQHRICGHALWKSEMALTTNIQPGKKNVGRN